MTTIVKRERIKALICWVLAAIALGIIFAFQIVYLSPKTVDLLFTFIIFMVAFGIRGVYQETKDTMLFDMGEVELESLKAQIEQTLKNREREEERKSA